MVFFSSFDAFLAHLGSLGLFHMDLSLGRIQKVLETLALPTPPCLIQIVGTNGKGSTAAFLESLGRAHGLATGLFTSPHFLNVRERILANGRELPEQNWLEAVERVMAAGGETLTYFELLTAMAVVLFHMQQVDLAVFEAGLGGTHDATTALDAHLVGVASIALDHTKVLGESLSAIARDKAGAIRQGRPVFSAPQQPEAMAELRRAAEEQQAHLVQTSPLGEDHTLGLAGEHQRINAGLATKLWEEVAGLLKLDADPGAIALGLRETFVPGRLQWVAANPGLHPDLILDAAHNPHGLDGLARHLKTLPEPPGCVLFACMADKDVEGMLSRLPSLTPGPIILPEHSWQGRECPAEELAARIGARAVIAKDLVQGLALAGDLPPSGTAFSPYCVVTGSLYFLAEFFTLRPDCLTPVPYAD